MNFSHIYCTPFLKNYFKSLCKDLGLDPVLVDPLALTAIIVFMSSIDTIDGVKSNQITYKGYLKIFFRQFTLIKIKNWLIPSWD